MIDALPFPGFGATNTDYDASYRFRMTLPFGYPGRAPRIYGFILRPGGGRELISKLSVLDAPGNQYDRVCLSLRRPDRQLRRLSPLKVWVERFGPGLTSSSDNASVEAPRDVGCASYALKLP